jgi:predicted RNase H-like HicB family nuclease
MSPTQQHEEMPVVTETATLSWVQTVRKSRWSGQRGGIPLVSVTYSPYRTSKDRPYLVNTVLPGRTGVNERRATIEEAMAEGERILAEWMTSLGFTATEKPALPEADPQS